MDRQIISNSDIFFENLDFLSTFFFYFYNFDKLKKIFSFLTKATNRENK